MKVTRANQHPIFCINSYIYFGQTFVTVMINFVKNIKPHVKYSLIGRGVIRIP